MKIAIDASHLTEHNRTGTHNYLYHLIKNLSLIDSTNEYNVYFKHSISTSFLEELFGQNNHFVGKVLPAKRFWTQVVFAREMFKENPEIIFCPWHTLPAFRPRRSKVVCTFHGIEYSLPEIPHALFTVWSCDHIVSVSEFTKKELVKKHFVSPKKISVVPEGVDTVEYKASDLNSQKSLREKYHLPDKYLFFVGTVGERKNVENMLRSFALASKQASDMYFVLAGHVPPEYEFIYDLVVQLGCEKKVTFLGRIPQEDLIPLLSGALALCYVSKSEGFGLPVLEAMSCGIPVLTTTKGAVPEIAFSAAVLVDPDSVNEISDALRKIWNDKDMRDALVEQGFARVLKYSWLVTAKKTLNLFERLVD